MTLRSNVISNVTAETTPRAGRREWIGLAVLALGALLYVMDLTVLHLAVPAISADLQPSSAQLLWIIDIYGFFVAGSLITMGTLGDRIGRRRLLFVGAAAFGVVSLLAAFSTSAEMLIVSRALLGIAGGRLAPSMLSLMFHMFQDPRCARVAPGGAGGSPRVWRGLWCWPAAFGFIVGSQFGPRIVGKFRPAFVIAGGRALAGGGLARPTRAGTSDGRGP